MERKWNIVVSQKNEHSEAKAEQKPSNEKTESKVESKAETKSAED